MEKYWKDFQCEGGKRDAVRAQTKIGFDKCNAECDKYFGIQPEATRTPSATKTANPYQGG
jgi:hypothetical protein